MTVGIKTSAGTDLDSVFDPYAQGTKPALTNIKSAAGQDLRDRYAPIDYGSQAPATGIKIASGADLNTLFAAYGSAVYQQIAAFLSSMTIVIPNGWAGLANQSYPEILSANGTGTRARGPTLAPIAFDWTSDGNPPLKNYQVRLSGVTVSQANGAWAFTNGTGGNWVALDDAHGATIATLKFIPSSNSGQGDYAASGQLEIRDASTLAIVYSQPMDIIGRAQLA